MATNPNNNFIGNFGIEDEKNQPAHEYKSYEGATVTIVKLNSPKKEKKKKKDKKDEKEEKEEKEEAKKDDKKESKTEETKKTKTLPKSKLGKADKYFAWMLAMYILIGILTFMIIEEFTFVDSLYFRMVSLFNIGYGDIIPTTHAGKILNALGFMVIDMCIFVYIYWRIFYLLFVDINTKFLENIYYLISCIAGIFLLLLWGTLVFHYGEGYDFVDAFIWNFDTITSVGYGSVTPISVSAKIFCIFYIIFGYLISLYLTVYILYSLKLKYIDQKSGNKSVGHVSVPSTSVLTVPKSEDEKAERAELLK